ncbi:MAG TPA: zf-HC2 domain-containing protein [Puia sp.]|uniref:anti-sigma factor family protein n=1 Tax=Puia sp. TaxID=2045100 RepID=UPI002C7DAA5E|nr:zf-HC2 domain-containing protein [Puia sp.]HVU96543.1 zf-HC2 domain-containing protein [Puia sp.]
MNCKEIQAAMMDYVDQALPAPLAAQLAEHLAGCDECRREADDLRQLLSAIKSSGQQQPSPTLRENFNTMLQSELNMETMANLLTTPEKEAKPRGKVIAFFTSAAGRAAAAVILLGGGIAIGMALKSSPPAPDTAVLVHTLQTEVDTMKKEMKEKDLLSGIDDQSASERIKAVSYADQMASPDQKVIDALFNSLNNDKNVNVRLAALYSLARFADRHVVRDSLVTSLGIQTEPIIQVVLINLLAEKRERKAIGPIREIMTNKKTLKEVKDAAQKSLTVL